jgi:hypothetical protein
MRPAILTGILATTALAATAAAAPIQVHGSDPWAVVLCNYTDAPAPPADPDAYRQLFAQAGTGGVVDYFHDISYGALDLSQTQVFGWFTSPRPLSEQVRWVDDGIVTAGVNRFTSGSAFFTAADVGKRVGFFYSNGNSFSSPIISVESSTSVLMNDTPTASMTGVRANIMKDRRNLVDDCVQDTRDFVNYAQFYGIVAVLNLTGVMGAVDVGPVTFYINDNPQAHGAVLLDLPSVNVGAAAHEMLHGYGMQHSWGDVPGLAPIEYGDGMDIMSFRTPFSFAGLGVGPYDHPSGPGMSALGLQMMGWLPQNRRQQVDRDQSWSVTALNHAELAGPLELVLPLDTPDHYLSIEYRFPDGWDRGIGSLLPSGLVEVHELKNGQSHLREYLVNGVGHAELLPGGKVLHLPDLDVAVAVSAFDVTNRSANVFISHDYVEPTGYGGNGSVTPPTGAGGCGAIGCGQGPPRRFTMQ